MSVQRFKGSYQFRSLARTIDLMAWLLELLIIGLSRGSALAQHSIWNDNNNSSEEFRMAVKVFRLD
jgi:hypothetical protein